MKFINKIFSLSAALLTALSAYSCKEETLGEAMAVMTSSSELSFPTTEAPEYTISVYADAAWTVEAPEWVSVSPMSGIGCMDINITVSDNLRDGSPDNPRKGIVYVTGQNLDIRGKITIMQDGDRYRDVAEADVTEVLGFENEAVVILKESTVMAATSKGFIVTDGTSNILVTSAEKVETGDRVTLRGDKGEEYSLPAIVNTSNVEVISNVAVEYPEALDLTESISAYTSDKREYISASGLLNGNKLVIEGSELSINVLNPVETLNLKSMDGHQVKLYGYFAGLAKPVVHMNVAKAEDLGGNGPQILLNDSFEWLADIAKAAGASDWVGNGGGTAPNVYTSAIAEAFAEAMSKHGYEDLNPSGKVLYLQGVSDAEGNYSGGYFKMGKTSVHTGLRLPAISTLTAPTDVTLTFKFAVQYGGTFKLDKAYPVVELEGDGTIEGGQSDKLSQVFYTSQKAYDADGNEISYDDQNNITAVRADNLWTECKVVIKGMTAETRIKIYPSDQANASNRYQRWYLGSVKIESGESDGGLTPDPNPGKLCCKWAFSADHMSAYAASFASAAGEESTKAEGDDSQSVANNLEQDGITAGTGSISYYSVDKSAIDVNNAFARTVGGTGHPYVTGAWPGDYWLFTATNGKNFAAGTKVHIKFITRISGTGQKYWMLEAWDGKEWKAAGEVKTATVNDTQIEYNFEPTTASSNSEVDFTWELAETCSIMKFRYSCVANYNAQNAVLEAPNSGTCRIAGAPGEDGGEGTSPVFEVL